MSRAVMLALADYVIENLDSDNEFYNSADLGELAVGYLMQYGYLIRCDACSERSGLPNVYYKPDGDCPNINNHEEEEEEDDEHQWCESCNGCSCECSHDEVDAAWA